MNATDSVYIFGDTTGLAIADRGFSWLTKDSAIIKGKVDVREHVGTYWKTEAIPANLKPQILPGEFFTDIYGGHLLHPSNHEPKPLNRFSPDWLFPVILFVLAVYAVLRIFYSKYFSQMLMAFINNNLTNQIVRDENLLLQRASIYLSVVFNLIAAMFLYLISVRLGWGMGGLAEGWKRFLFLAGLVSAIYALKFLILKIAGWLFDSEREMSVYIFNIFLINNVLGMALLPFVCLMAYNQALGINFLMILCVVLAGLAFIYRLFRGITVGLGAASFSPLYLFLYLCTLEIAPLMVVWRIIAA